MSDEPAEAQGKASKATNVPVEERRKLWARAAGRCAICGASLLEGAITAAEMTLGEAAHIVGRTDSKDSPRGQSDLPTADRNNVENLVLICASHHDEIDRPEAVDLVTVERLLAFKAKHEAFIRRATGLRRDQTTAILRLRGDIRGDAAQLSVGSAIAAVLDAGYFPEFQYGFDGVGVVIELDQLPDEMEPTAEYWTVAMRQIDQVVDHKIKAGIRDGAIQHLSVFGFARLPLLVYLGSELDDVFPTLIFQRHRTGDTWVWPKEEGEARFELTSMDRAPQEDAVVILNISGTIEPSAIPAELAEAPRVTIAATAEAPAPETIRTRADLERFSGAVRSLFAQLERDGKIVKRLHVLAAAPVSAAIALGRAHDPHVHPALVIYQRTGAGVYEHALTIP